MENFLFDFLVYNDGSFAYIFAFSLLLACGLGLPIPEDIILFTMGYLSYLQIVDFSHAVIICLIGVLIGDFIVYFLGRKFGRRLLSTSFFSKIFPDARIEKTRLLFQRWGNKVIFAARFMPGLRAPTYFSMGMLHQPFRLMLLYDGIAAVISVPLLTGATYYFGDQIQEAIGFAKRIQFGIIFLILLIILFFVAKHFILNRKKKNVSP